MKDPAPKSTHLTDYTSPAWRVPKVSLCFELEPEETRVTAMLCVEHVDGHPQRDLVLFGEELVLESLSQNGEPLDSQYYELTKDGLVIRDLDESCELEIVTRIHPKRNTALSGLYISEGHFCTQCEAEGFRRITYFPDRPDVLSVYDVRIEADEKRYPVLLSNGNPVAQGELDNGRHFAHWHDPFPKPSYLFALVAGDLACHSDQFVTASGRTVDLRLYVQAHNLDQCSFAMQALKKSMRWDEQAFGREYDLDIFMIVAVDDFNMGAMENKGLNIFNSKCVLASPQTATDDDFIMIESIIAHEYFHNWSGNRVTCRDWFQLSLKEGLTVFRDQEFTADQTLPGVKRIQDVQRLRNLQFPEDAGPMSHPVRPQSYLEINNFYTMTIYEKGAEVVRMLQTLLGASLFRRGLDLYFDRHDGQAVTTDDFVKALEDASGRDLSLFRRWYDQAGTPVLEIQEGFDDSASEYHLSLRQHCPSTPGQDVKMPLHIPVSVALFAASGEKIPCGADAAIETTLELTEQQQTFVFKDVHEPPVLSLLRGFSAPVIVRDQHRPETLAFLMQHEDDAFSRWEAGQRFALNILLAWVADCQNDRQLLLDPRFSQAFAALLKDAQSHPALVAETMTLPSESYLGDQLSTIDVEAVHMARCTLMQQLGQQCFSTMVEIYEKTQGIAGFDALALGQRRLHNLCLTYLCASGESEAQDRALQHYHHAPDMTHTMGALRALIAQPGEVIHQCLGDFEQRWKDQPLVLDKWFSLQAMAPWPDSLERVQDLMRHPGFSLRNPNRVRAVLGSFTMANPLGFHAIDGQAYAFMAELILELDAINPQIAARLAGCFSRWRRFDAVRQNGQQQALQRILAQPSVSRDLYEIASRSLG
ncbi:aminopeptidase N [Ectothiorhodosinus mongolicus]|uniref:Aminopeptidase N n=1 Tax=Ectothiorhodosinus mongolicus TaxID=233100 RepID=A0A1R3W2E1_9GAMM|nr:aminopeptidase N [Ectothiorhodosinus mongolicus]ULX57969.1 aminopeptidase N [Ectothiorhodosinus mongolicus]SIT70693.1 aminopeptidase N [Ectothiorhodosinus mongolicus]